MNKQARLKWYEALGWTVAIIAFILLILRILGVIKG